MFYLYSGEIVLLYGPLTKDSRGVSVSIFSHISLLFPPHVAADKYLKHVSCFWLFLGEHF